MGKEQAFTVKIYFIDPIDSISLLIDALINLEYEVYIISYEDRNKILKIIEHEKRSILFFCIQSKNEILEWFAYANKVKKNKNTNIQLGAFVYDKIEEDEKNKFLLSDVPVIKFSTVKNKTLEVLNKIFLLYEAKSRRSFIRVKTFGTADAYFSFKNKAEPVICKIIDISAHAFSIEIDPFYKDLFAINSYIENITIVLQGVRINASAKVVGYNFENPNIYILKFYSVRVQNDKAVFVEVLPTETKIKIHGYIRRCLKHEITEKLKTVKE